ncbi:hypothetical protein [Flavobacterium seoulense]|uniref:Phosphoribosylpyrophosphate synthetase n=1 Tax=Flavobacterium seoulense TaxID=1492738 RepID=A0A066WUB1_9FLAO|nr:hypothetical protein [Flavobacterium seoulense]KDN54554.1 hypothetical protein FEM21_22770 [Flavobacterium seoulense]
MKNPFDKHEIDYIKIYQDKGYTANFYFEDNKFLNTETKTEYDPTDIFIVAEHRYEGMSNPSDMSILYVIETTSGDKGTVLLGFGPSADLELAEFFNEIPKGNISKAEDIDDNK